MHDVRAGDRPFLLQLVEVAVEFIDIVYYFFYVSPGDGERVWSECSGKEQLLIPGRGEIPGLALQPILGVLKFNPSIHHDRVFQRPRLEGVEAATAQ